MIQYQTFGLHFKGSEPEGSRSVVDLKAEFYYGRHCTAVGDMKLPQQGSYRVEVIDVWEMTRTTILTGVSGNVEFALPGKEGIAVLATAV